MKSAVMAFILAVIVLSCTIFVFADDISYKIDDLNMDISIPNNFTVVTRSIEDDSAYLENNNTDKQSLIAQLINKHIYLIAIDESRSIELIITMIENDDISSIYDFNSSSHKQLSEYAEKLMGMDTQEYVSSVNDEGQISMSSPQLISFDKYYISKRKQATFLVFDIQMS